MKLAVLFWFYKDFDVCINRLQILRKYNPDIKIFGLYGGQLNTSKHFEEGLSAFLNDFYCFDGSQDPKWKWMHGDLMINHWFRERGQDLEWDTITIVQEDMVAVGNICQMFESIKEGEILLSSTRLVKDVESWWYWIKEHRQLYDTFYNHLVNKYQYNHEPVCCQYVVVCLPRIFLEMYSKVEKPELGFIEYRVPMYAQLFKIPFHIERQFDCWWGDDPAMVKMPVKKRVLIADKTQVPLKVILYHLAKRNGSRIFHPFDYIFPYSVKTALDYTNKFLARIISTRLNKSNETLK